MEQQLQEPMMVEHNMTNSKERLASIIIPNYNHAQYVGEAIQSVLDQNYRDFEIIVVDDGSIDASREVIAGFGNQVRYIWQENQGLSAARNTGIRAAEGAYIGLLDADDMYEPAFLSTLVSILEDNDDAAGVYCGYQFVDHLNHPLPQKETRLFPDEQLFQALVDSNFLVPESMLVRRSYYESVGPFDETLRALEDWDMWLRLANRYKIIGTDQVLTRHRILPGSMSSDPIRMLDNRLAVVKKHFGEEPAVEEIGVDLKRRAYGRAYLASSVEYLQYGDEDRAYSCFQKMAEVGPDLLTQLDTFYQLGLGTQPKGSLGHFDSLDLQRNARVLIDMLDRLFGSPILNERLRSYQRSAYANAYFALALQNYGARHFKETRRLLFSAIVADPSYVSNRRFLMICLKALMPSGFVDQLKVGRRKMVVQ